MANVEKAGALVPVTRDGALFHGRDLPAATGPLLGAFAGRYLEGIPYDPADVERIHALSRKGVVVYTHRSANWVDLLFVQRALPRNNLPHAHYVAGFDARAFHPWWSGYRKQQVEGLPQDPVAAEEWRLEQVLRARQSALVFLKHPATLINPKPQQQAHYARSIIRAQRTLDVPIFLVPQVIIWIHRPGHFRPTLGDVVFGTSDSPGALRAFGIAWLLYRWAKVRVAEPVDVQKFIADNPGVPDDILARKLRFAVAYGLGREQRILNGPPLKTHARMKEETLRDGRLQKTIRETAHQEGVPVTAIQARASAQYDEVASKFDVDVMAVVDWILRVVWNRIYDGLEVDPADIQKLRETARKASLVLVPCHRSHVDYLVLGQVLYWNGMMPPLVAAGINLSFWPLGPILRRGGAYFIRRSFKGDVLYPNLVRTYIKHMLKEGFFQEFFVEGGRSRTGKTLPPKLGMVSFVVDAFLDGAQKDVAFVPVHIGYEKIVEGSSYARELSGDEKERESIKGLLGATRVLRHKYGRVYVTFDEPVLLRDYLAQRGVTQEKPGTPDDVRNAVRALGHRIVYGINHCAVVTPSAVAALAMLGHHQRGLGHRTLMLYAERILEHVRRVTDGQARISPVLVQNLDAALREAMTRLAEEQLVDISGAGGEIFYRAAENHRVKLDYYKNNIVHFFVPDGIVATALLSLTSGAQDAVPLSAVRERALFMSRVLKMEFEFRQGTPFDRLFEETVTRNVSLGFVKRQGDTLAVHADALAQQTVRFASNLLLNFLEGYRHALAALPRETAAPRTRKDLTQALLDRVRAAFLAGELHHSEAVNKSIMENVLELSVDQGWLKPDGEGSSSPLRAAADLPERLKAFTVQLGALLRPPPPLSP